MLTTDRTLRQKMGPRSPQFAGSVAAGFTVYRNSITAVCADGTLVPAGATGTPSAPVAILGLARHMQINTANFPGTGPGVGGSTAVDCLTGCYDLPFSDTAPTWADKGKPVYAVDDETVSLTQTPEGGTARLQVGVFAGIDADGTPYTEI